MIEELFRPPSLEEALALAERVDHEATRLQGSVIALRSFGDSTELVEALERDVDRMRRAAEILTWIGRRADRLHELTRPRARALPSLDHGSAIEGRIRPVAEPSHK